MKICLDTLGCKLNQAETELLARRLSEDGHVLVSRAEPADAYILNTCTVTGVADAKCRRLLRQARRRNPGALVIAAGCYAQRAPDELSRMDAVDMVVSNDGKVDLPAVLGDLAPATGAIPASTAPPYVPAMPKTRSFVKIQDGCTSGCAYCIVPKVRGHETSLFPDQVVAEVASREAEGYREVVLTGTKVGTYRYGGFDLVGLLERILAGTGIARLRLSSLQPQELSPELVRLWGDARLCPHFHLSLQSGSDRTLQRMRRRYLAAGYRRAVEMLREHVPHAAITTDIIVGFPGETDDDFEESYRFCQGIGFARIHVFPFSARPGTEAAGLDNEVDGGTRKERTRSMLALAAESARRFREQLSGSTVTVLWERQDRQGWWTGVTENYLRVHTRSREDLANRLQPVTLP